MLVQTIAILGGVVYPLRRYALRLSDEPIYFGAGLVVAGTVAMALAR
jgi:hypothetical protein